MAFSSRKRAVFKQLRQIVGSHPLFAYDACERLLCLRETRLGRNVAVNEDTSRSRARKPMGFAARAVAFAAVLALAALLVLGLSSSSGDSSHAYATIYHTDQVAQVDDDASNDAVQPSEEDGAETEILDDEETPLSSGLEGGEPSSGGIGFGPIAIIGIAVVALFFLVLMRRLNGNINDMSRMFK